MSAPSTAWCRGVGNLFRQSAGDRDDVGVGVPESSPPAAVGWDMECCRPAGALEDEMPAWPPSQDGEGTISIPVLEPWPWVDLG